MQHFEMSTIDVQETCDNSPLRISHKLSANGDLEDNHSRVSHIYHPDCSMMSSHENLSTLSYHQMPTLQNLNRAEYQRRRCGSIESQEYSDSSSLNEPTEMENGICDLDQLAQDLGYGVIHSEVLEIGNDKLVWETHHVVVDREPGFGFGIAVSGGVDNPHFSSGEVSIAISDVLKGGPAYGKLKPKDRIISINGIELDSEKHSTAISLLRDCGEQADLIIRRRVFIPSPHSRQEKSITIHKSQSADKNIAIEIGCKYYIKSRKNNETSPDTPDIEEGDFILKVNNKDISKLSLPQVQKLIDRSKGKLELTLERPPKPIDSCGSSEGLRSRSHTFSSGYNSVAEFRSRCNSLKNSVKSPVPVIDEEVKNRLACQHWLSASKLLEGTQSSMRPRSYSSPKQLHHVEPENATGKPRAESFSANSLKSATYINKRQCMVDRRRQLTQYDNRAFVDDEALEVCSQYSPTRSSESSGIWFIERRENAKQENNSYRF